MNNNEIKYIHHNKDFIFNYDGIDYRCRIINHGFIHSTIVVYENKELYKWYHFKSNNKILLCYSDLYGHRILDRDIVYEVNNILKRLDWLFLQSKEQTKKILEKINTTHTYKINF